MLTSDFCQPPSKSNSSGFTLIEVLVVLIIAGLLAGVALPKLFLISQRYAIAADRDKLLTEIGNLGYSAYARGKPVELISSDGVAAQDYALSIPYGWRVEVPKTIRFNFNGICTGGTLTLSSPDGSRENFQLVAPACKPEAQGSAP